MDRGRETDCHQRRGQLDELVFVGRRVYDSPGKYRDEGVVTEDGWQTVDKVMNPETKVFYSSKPPLLPTLLAGEYWLIKQAIGAGLEEQPFYVARLMLLITNVLPLLLYFVLLVPAMKAGSEKVFPRPATSCSGSMGSQRIPRFTFNLLLTLISSWK